MANGSGGARASYRLKDKYSIDERHALLIAYRVFAAKVAKANRGKVSVGALNDIIDGAFNTFAGWNEVNAKFRAVSRVQLDHNTLRKILRCDLTLEVRKLHLKSLHVIDAFLQIEEQERPEFLIRILKE